MSPRWEQHVEPEPRWPGPVPRAVVVDLDDTIYPQAAYLRGAAAAVGAAAAHRGLDGDAVTRALEVELNAGSDRGGTVDRALAACGLAPEEVATVLPALVQAFLHHRPDRLPLYPGAAEALAALRARYPLACLTDGNPLIQRAKLAATGIGQAVDAVVVTDELGGRHVRKPHPVGLLHAAHLLEVPPECVVMIGDRPAKDVAVAAAVGAMSVRVRTGEYAHAHDEPAATLTVPDLATAAVVLCAAAPAGPARYRPVGRWASSR